MQHYNRAEAVDYARKWATGRNPDYMDYEDLGGDCTNFISQCLHHGGIPFDHNGDAMSKHWYWYSEHDRTPSWTGVHALRTYLLGNNDLGTCHPGVYATVCHWQDLEPGDLVQKEIDGNLTHTMIVTKKVLDDQGKVIDYLICQHSYDLEDFPLSKKDGILHYIKIHGYYD